MSSNGTNTDNQTKTSTNEVMKQLESKVNDTAIQISQVATNAMLNNPGKEREIAGKTADILQKIMTDGAEEFKEKTGRPMTYAEMRALWG